MGVLIHHNHTGYEMPHDNQLTQLALAVIRHEKLQAGEVNVIFTDNKEILQLNRQYLNHDYYTDVIAFHYGPTHDVQGDVFISLDKVDENARDYGTGFQEEILRVTIHGLLHLIGYTDSTDEEKQNMRSLEDRYIEYYHRHFR